MDTYSTVSECNFEHNNVTDYNLGKGRELIWIPGPLSYGILIMQTWATCAFPRNTAGSLWPNVFQNLVCFISINYLICYWFFHFPLFNMIHNLLKFHLAEVNIQSDFTLHKELKFKLAMSRSFNTVKQQVLLSD